MFQPTQAYPSNPQPENKKDFSSDEHSNPDLYDITRPDKCNTTETIESKVSDEMNPVDKPAMTSDLDGMETQAYVASDEDVAISGKPDRHIIQPTLPYNMMETQAYDADSDEQDSDVEKSVGKQSKTTENIEPTLPYNMMETRAYDAQEESLNTCSRQPETSTETTNKDIPIEPTLPYDLAEAEKVEEEEKEEDAVILETQAYGAGDDSETDDETSEIPNTVARPSQASENREKQAENSQGAGMTLVSNILH